MATTYRWCGHWLLLNCSFLFCTHRTTSTAVVLCLQNWKLTQNARTSYILHSENALSRCPHNTSLYFILVSSLISPQKIFPYLEYQCPLLTRHSVDIWSTTVLSFLMLHCLYMYWCMYVWNLSCMYTWIKLFLLSMDYKVFKGRVGFFWLYLYRMSCHVIYVHFKHLSMDESIQWHENIERDRTHTHTVWM
jgi:hypothetical protein